MENHMKRFTVFVCLIALLVLAIGVTAQAATRSAVASGVWSATTTWSGGAVPLSTDNATIAGGFTVTVDINTAVCTILTIGKTGAGAGAGHLVFNNSSQLTASGTCTFGTATAADSGIIDMTSGGTLILQGTVTSNTYHTLYGGTGTIEYNGSAAQSVAAEPYYNLTISSGNTATLAGADTVYGNLSVVNGTFAEVTRLLRVMGSTTISSGAFMSSTLGSPTFVGSFDNSGTITTGATTTTWSFGSSYTNESGASHTTARAVVFKGSFQNNGTFSQSASTATFSGASTQTLSGSGSTSFNQLQISNTSGVTLSQAISCNILVLAAGNLDNTSFNVTTATGSATTGVISRSNGTISVAPNFGTTPTVQYTASTAPLTTGPELPTAALFNFTVNDAQGVTLASNVTVNDTLRLTSGTLTTTGSYKVTVTNAVPGAVIARANPSVGNLSGELDVYIGATSNGIYTFTDTSTVIVPDGTQGAIDVDMQVYPNTQPVPTPGTGTAVSRYYVITPSGALTATTMQLSYLVSELGSITESNLTLWYYNGSAWVNFGGIDNTTGHFVPVSGGIVTGNWAFADPASPLPIQLSSFTASTVANNVNLKWSTISETNTLGFYVERGSSKTGPFTTVSSLIAGAGTSLQQHNYTYTDNSVSTGTYYYRVRQVEKNGKTAYSSVLSVVAVSERSWRSRRRRSPGSIQAWTKLSEPLQPDDGHQVRDQGCRVHNVEGVQCNRSRGCNTRERHGAARQLRCDVERKCGAERCILLSPAERLERQRSADVAAQMTKSLEQKSRRCLAGMLLK